MVYQKYNQKLFNAILSVDFDFYSQSVKEAKSFNFSRDGSENPFINCIAINKRL